MTLPPESPHPKAPLVSALCVRALEERGRALDPQAYLSSLRSLPYRWLLESALRAPGTGRQSFLGADPYLVLSAYGTRAELEVRRAARPDLEPGRCELEQDPLDIARALLPPAPTCVEGEAGALDFIGGAVGFLGYELVTEPEGLGLHARDELGLPDLVLLYVDRVLVLDPEEGPPRVAALGFGHDRGEAARRARGAADGMVRSLGLPGAARPRAARAPEQPEPAGLPAVGALELDACFDEAGYAKAVTEILHEIEAGNVYQANLTHRLGHAYEGDPLRLYQALRQISPAPFAAYLELPGGASVVSSSPERFLHMDAQGAVESRPIKGTRPRGQNAHEDAALESALASSEKDRAENLMIVDLVRNDLGRVCALGSIEVRDLMVVERYATVFQLVSTVRGRLRPDCDAIDLVRATFPPGSMTGAPKIAAMKLLDRLEPVRRGIYSGALGYFDVRGGLDLSVVIRALIVASGRVHLHVGGGVVADSDPVAEYQETLDKARALRAALESVLGHGAEGPRSAGRAA